MLQKIKRRESEDFSLDSAFSFLDGIVKQKEENPLPA